MWIFAVLTRIQIFFTLIAAGFPALKQTVLDLSTSFGAADRSHDRSQSDCTFSLRTLTKKGRRLAQGHPTVTSFAKKHNGHSGAMKDTSAHRDDESQKGIMRQQEYEIAVMDNGASEESTAGHYTWAAATRKEHA